jgi:hypothetical protein
MDPFSYLVVLTSIILGLGVTRLVGGLGHLMQREGVNVPTGYIRCGC